MSIPMRATCLYGIVLSLIALLHGGCNSPKKENTPDPGLPIEKTVKRIPVILDTDTNNELDDQHAMAYLLYNQDVFDVKGITINTTLTGGDINAQYAEAERIMKLCAIDSIPIKKGADKSFRDISEHLKSPTYDGYEAVDLITRSANEMTDSKLTVIAVGKLTNIALAVQKDPGLIGKIKLVWLGSNYPDPGEHNLVSDSVPMNYLLNTDIEFEIVTVRSSKANPSGTSKVTLSKEDALKKLPGIGPAAAGPITGRHGGEFTNLGDYLANLFQHIPAEQQERPLFDMAAIAIVKNPAWAQSRVIPAPIMINSQWVDRPQNSRTVTIWENFNKDAIIKDFFASF